MFSCHMIFGFNVKISCIDICGFWYLFLYYKCNHILGIKNRLCIHVVWLLICVLNFSVGSQTSHYFVKFFKLMAINFLDTFNCLVTKFAIFFCSGISFVSEKLVCIVAYFALMESHTSHLNWWNLSCLLIFVRILPA